MIVEHRPLAPKRIVFWLAAATVFLLLLWLLRGMLLPFVLGMALAYVCDPLADRLERIHIPRSLATILVLGVFVGIFVVALVLLLPMIQAQIIELIEQVPHYADLMRRTILPEITHFVQRVSGSHDAADVRKAATSYAGTVSGWVVRILSNVWSSGLIVFNVLYVILLTPLVAFYFLRDWHRIIALLDSWVPRRHVQTFREVAHDIDAILAGFVRGQATVCFIFAVYYSLALSLAGLNFAIIIGIAAGVLTFIPYLGAIVGLVASVVVAFGQFDDYSRVVIVAVVYLIGHLVEANLVTPNLVGDRVKLHPVWVIFALLAGGALFGFMGVLLAVPVAAVIGVLVRFGLARYLASSLYVDPLEPVPLLDVSEL